MTTGIALWHNGAKVKILLCLSVIMPVFSPLMSLRLFTFYYKSWICLCLELILNGPSSFALIFWQGDLSFLLTGCRCLLKGWIW